MSHELMTTTAEIENLQNAAREDAGFEKLLKFKKGVYSTRDGTIPLGTEYIAHVKAWIKCWIKFTDGEVVDRKPYRVANGEIPPEREELDDLDPAQWSKGIDGNPADPWVFQYLVPLEDPSTGEVVVFVTSSFGGRRAVGDLCSAFTKRTKKVANCGQPIVKLAVGEMPSRKYGPTKCPLFEVIGWDEAASGAAEVMPPDDFDGGMPDEHVRSIPF